MPEVRALLAVFIVACIQLLQLLGVSGLSEFGVRPGPACFKNSARRARSSAFCDLKSDLLSRVGACVLESLLSLTLAALAPTLRSL